MKIRHPLVLKWIGFVGALLIRLYVGTLAYRYRPVGPNMNPLQKGFQGRYVYAFWHENILLPCYHYARRDIRVLISEHADGEMIARAAEHIGFGTVRGSATRGGTRALLKMIRASRNCHIAVVPDGPRGPRRHVELGLVYLAARTGLPLVLMGIGYDRPWRLRTWDRFALPRPWSRAVLITLPPMEIPADAGKEQLEAYRLQVEKSLNDRTEYAERMASGAA
jgi:lysophospholipid acyltransferase (LPLAT)-like uncharacterized protein